MHNKKNSLVAAAALVITALAGVANATAVSGQGTWETTLLARDINGNPVALGDASTVFLYDTALNITWLKDANYAKTSGYSSTGLMTWAAASTWTANLVVGAYDDWRMPTWTDTGAPGVQNVTSSPYGGDGGYKVDPASSEMAHLFFVTLGDKGFPDSGFGLSNTGPFANMQSYNYWSSTEYAPVPSAVWFFNFTLGSQGSDYESSPFSAWAVRPGDVAPVPLPGALGLLMGGLGLFGTTAARRMTSRRSCR